MISFLFLLKNLSLLTHYTFLKPHLEIVMKCAHRFLLIQHFLHNNMLGDQITDLKGKAKGTKCRVYNDWYRNVPLISLSAILSNRRITWSEYLNCREPIRFSKIMAESDQSLILYWIKMSHSSANSVVTFLWYTYDRQWSNTGIVD